MSLFAPFAVNLLRDESHHDDEGPPVGSTGFVYVTFSTATFSLPLSSVRSWYT